MPLLHSRYPSLLLSHSSQDLGRFGFYSEIRHPCLFRVCNLLIDALYEYLHEYEKRAVGRAAKAKLKAIKEFTRRAVLLSKC
ncbi:hypothetical protein U9M48_037913 [Paspalum notatum var. saurae]|uniref:Uncharacterized protein n=1 Tax=Paspalum notatum var. saurae TaxID=547442 RepID=A0AAQ3UKV6_PASNO